MTSRDFARYRAAYDLEPWGEERRDHRAMTHIVYTAPPGRKIDVDAMTNAINPWAENFNSADAPTLSVGAKVRLFNAGLQGAGRRRR